MGDRFMRGILLKGFAIAAGFTALGCDANDNGGQIVPIVPVGPAIAGLHVVGNHLEDSQGTTVVLRGVNRSGTEYQCVHGASVFDGAWGVAAIAAIASWKINVVRIPLNESCWLAGGSNSNNTYKQAVGLFVSLLHQFHITPILELHWVGPGDTAAVGQQPMPDADHAEAFWLDVATTYANDDGVVFELYNEPYPDSDHDTPAAWQCWRDGCAATLWAFQVLMPGANPVWSPTMSTYQAIGMQALVAAVRSVAPQHLILLGGIQYSNSLSQWMAYAPSDANVAPAWHVYNFNPCKTEACWNATPATLATMWPIVTTELGEDDCAGIFIDPFMQWLDGHGASYLAWSWNSAPSCIPGRASGGRPWPMVVDYNSGTPSGAYAQSFHDHLAAIVGANP
jgi:endoglucanase